MALGFAAPALCAPRAISRCTALFSSYTRTQGRWVGGRMLRRAGPRAGRGAGPASAQKRGRRTRELAGRRRRRRWRGGRRGSRGRRGRCGGGRLGATRGDECLHILGSDAPAGSAASQPLQADPCLCCQLLGIGRRHYATACGETGRPELLRAAQRVQGSGAGEAREGESAQGSGAGM